MTNTAGDELVRARLDLPFPGADHGEALNLLTQDCGPGLPSMPTDSDLVRVQAAALKCSGGTLKGLVDAVALAQTDWRDLLVVAGFAHDTRAHLVWLRNLESDE